MIMAIITILPSYENENNDDLNAHIGMTNRNGYDKNYNGNND